MAAEQPVTSLGCDQSGTLVGRASGKPKPARTRSEIAKANIRKGKERERNVVSFLRVNGFPGAERTVRTGYRNSGRTSPDQGDITGTPGIGWQVKDVAEREWWRIPKFMTDTELQADAARADFGVLVVRRPGHAHPGEWWAHMWFDDLLQLVASDRQEYPVSLRFPVRFELQDLIPLLRVAGYGSPPGAASTEDSVRRGVADVEAGRFRTLMDMP